MRQGFIKTAAVTPKIKVADPVYNAQRICELMNETEKRGAKIVVFPELCITGYTCQDLFFQDYLIESAKEQLALIVEHSRGMQGLFYVGLPLEWEGKLYNVAAVLFDGNVLAFIPKAYIPSYNEFYETRHFAPGNKEVTYISYRGSKVPFGCNILLESESVKGLLVGCELCEDLWVVNPPSSFHAMAGATVIVNLSASDETIAKDSYRLQLVKATSARLLAAYIYSSAGEGESTQDVVYSGHNIIAENGTLLGESERFKSGILYADIDINRLRSERRKMNTFYSCTQDNYLKVSFKQKLVETQLDRTFPQNPFVPQDKVLRDKRCEDILSIQAYGLKKRYEHTSCQSAVIGVSGGLDSTLALLVTVKTFDLLGISREKITAVTMPCFGTTDRTYKNACTLVRKLGATLREISIENAVKKHFDDIEHDSDVHDVTYENSQARERTQILMDIANQTNGLVIGTGDLSELALGWATYNGDHMSMYGVNVGVPKTLVRYLVRFYADTCHEDDLEEVLLDILDTPVSPELLPPEDGAISQKTEDLVGPYELHDFFLYYMMRMGYEPAKIYRIAVQTFSDTYDKDVIKKWLHVFYKRFFAQQFKRSCMPDGPKVGSVALSPRGDLRMPSDATGRIWLDQLDQF